MDDVWLAEWERYNEWLDGQPELPLDSVDLEALGLGTLTQERDEIVPE